MNVNSINERVFRFLAGDWSVCRSFDGNYRGTFTGKASFALESEDTTTYSCTEQGELIDGEGKGFDAKQSYLYRLAEGKLHVLKREELDWMVMHELDFNEHEGVATASHVHLCGQDHYATEYRIDLETSRWEVAYSVNGPKKDYRIHSVYA